jgi:23S rRNA pseudouridine1911/1915/1917 synthase
VDILYEDNHVIVVDKPAGLLTQPSGTDGDNLEDRVKKFIKKRGNKPGKVFLEAVHRLDKPAFGLVVFAKTSKALSRLNAAQREKKFRKFYRAKVEGALPKPEGTLENILFHDRHIARVVGQDHPKGKQAVLHYREIDGESNLVEIELVTGRYHQIRAQLAHIGCPIVGDKKYGSLTHLPSGIYLEHYRVEFPHPTKGGTLKINKVI